MDQRDCNLHPSFQSKSVYVLQCTLCESTVCVRGMKAMLLADRSMELYSTDLPPPRYVKYRRVVWFVYAIHALTISVVVCAFVNGIVCGLVVAKLWKFKTRLKFCLYSCCLQECRSGGQTLHHVQLPMSDQGCCLQPLVS